MKNNYKILISSFVVVILIFATLLSFGVSIVYANEGVDGEVGQNYVIYDESYNYLFEKASVEVGDMYIDKSYKKYEVIFVNKQNKTGVAKFVKQLEKPNIKFSKTPSQISQGEKNIGLYCTHNDESYLPSEGYYSIYGKGGIHDIAKKIKTTFENSGVNVVFDESLHLPHDGSAYARSSVTAKKLLKENNLDALFDIHRDGVSRSFYVANVDGLERSKVRIVLGKSNSNIDENEKFALYVRAVADELYPWLISDIYYASGHYNQGLYEKALLFEMGTYLIEKELVLKSVEPLVHSINVALYNTTVDTTDGKLEIGGTPTAETPHINDVFEIKKSDNEYSILGVIFVLALILFVSMIILQIYLVAYKIVSYEVKFLKGKK